MASNSSLGIDCEVSGHVSALIVFAFTLTKALLLLPLYTSVLCLGRQQRRSSAPARHSDVITYHMFAIEMIFILAGLLLFVGEYTGAAQVRLAGIYIFNMTYPGQMLLHVLTCVERYLAVVHPVTYVGLKNPLGVRIRNVSIGSVWLLCFGWIGLQTLTPLEVPVLCLLVLSLIVTSYCSLAALRALRRPGPGQAAGDGERVGRARRRAFHTITGITGVLLMWVVGLLVNTSLSESKVLSRSDYCVALAAGLWSCLPSSLVLPLLFLHRAGRLQCCCTARK